MSEPRRYRAHPGRRIRAFLLTDRVGHAIASVLDLTKLLRWWLPRGLRRLAGLVPSSRSHGDSETPGG